MNTIKTISRVNETELKFGIINSQGSWHNKYKDSCWIYVGGLKFEYSEGDVICVFSQYGEIVNINLIRDRFTGKSKGFCFLCYEDQRSTILAVDNFNGTTLGGRTLRVDHVEDYKLPDLFKNENDVLKKFLYLNGCGPQHDEEIKQLQEESDKIKIQLDAEVDEYISRKQAREARNKIIDDDRSSRNERSHSKNDYRRRRSSRSPAENRRYKKEFKSPENDNHRSRHRRSRSRSSDRHRRRQDRREESDRNSHKKRSHRRSSS